MSAGTHQRPKDIKLALTLGGRLLIPLAAAGLVAAWIGGGAAGLFAVAAGGLLLLVPGLTRLHVSGLELALPGTHRTAVGQPFELELNVFNRGPLPLGDLVVLAGKDPSGDPRPVGALAKLAAGRTGHCTLQLRLFERGRYDTQAVTVIATYPLGLWRVACVFELEADLWALPRLGSVSRLRLPTTERAHASTRSRIPRVGDEEFVGVRAWREGESLRRVHWPLSARADRWVTRILRAEDDPPLHLVLVLEVEQPGLWERRDASFEKAVSLVASLAARELSKGRTVHASLGAGGSARPLVLRGRPGLARWLEALAEVRHRPGDPWQHSQVAEPPRDLPVYVLAGGGRGPGRVAAPRWLDVDEPAISQNFDREAPEERA